MRLLFILPEFYPTTGGGICTYYQELIANWSTHNVEITVLQGSLTEARGGSTQWKGIDIHYLDTELFDRFKKRFTHFTIFPEFQKHLASSWATYELASGLNKTFDVVITTDWGFGFVPWIIRNELPVVMHLHGSVGQIGHYEPRPGTEFWSKLYLMAETSFLSQADVLVTHSHQNISFWKKRLETGKDIYLVPPAIPAVISKPTKIGKQKNMESVGLVVGRIQYWKGVIQLCEAIKLLSEEKKSRLKIYWIGRDTFYHESQSGMNEYLSKTYTNIWNKIVIPVGSKTHEEIESYYSLADWTLVPSTWDMFNLTAVEHIMHRKALVCSTGAGAPDLLSGSNDVVIFDNTPEELAIAIATIINKDQSELEKMAEGAYEFAAQIFDPASICNKHISVIKQAIRDFNKRENLSAKFDWLMPLDEQKLTRNPKEELLSNWPLNELPKLFLNRVREKLQK